MTVHIFLRLFTLAWTFQNSWEDDVYRFIFPSQNGTPRHMSAMICFNPFTWTTICDMHNFFSYGHSLKNPDFDHSFSIFSNRHTGQIPVFSGVSDRKNDVTVVKIRLTHIKNRTHKIFNYF